jgi:nitrite reductase/ring-hydroxylating ferredoxin subunit
MLTHEQNELLTRVEGDAPMGRLMREHCWVPALLTSQITPDGAPMRVRLLGRDHVAFRASDGRVGFFDEGCPHRGTSLVLARNEDCALRCIFHGWRIDVSGRVVEVPTHTPNPEAFAAKVHVRHYPTHESNGLIWVWLGAGEPAPVPKLPFSSLPATRVWLTATKCVCNWMQGVEATLDTAHVGTLHESYINRSRDMTIGLSLDALAPRYDVTRTPYGLDASATRELPDGSTYIRATKYLMPFISLAPGVANSEISGGIFIVSPVDDTHHTLFFGCWSDNADINDGRGIPACQSGIMGDLPYNEHDFGAFTAGQDENFGQSREAMRDGHFTGFTGNLLQEDTVTQASMGPIVDRTKEHLSSSDVAIIHARRLLLAAAASVAAGGTFALGSYGCDDVVPIDRVDPPAAIEPEKA